MMKDEAAGQKHIADNAGGGVFSGKKSSATSGKGAGIESGAGQTEASADYDTSYGKIIKYTGILGGTQGLGMLVALLRNKLTSVFLGASGMGIVALLQSLVTLLANLTNLGIPMSAIQHVSDCASNESARRLDEYVAVVRTWVVTLAVLGTLLCALLAPLLNALSFKNTGDYTLEIILLSPMVGFLTVTGGELALLKAVRRLKLVAVASLVVGVGTLLSTVPFYYFLKEKGIVLALWCSTCLMMLVHLYYTRRVFPWHMYRFSRSVFIQGVSMVRLGAAFTMSAIFAGIAEWLIPVYILNQTSPEQVAFFKMGFSLMVTYPGMVFVALEADYYPRLSAIYQDAKKMRASVNQQIEICVMMVAPVLMAFILLLPVAVPLLYTREFLPIVDMAVCAGMYMFFKGVTIPMAYLPLVHKDLKIYLVVELLYQIVLVASVIFAFTRWGLVGGGVALAFTGLFDMLQLLLAYYWRYGFRLYRHVVMQILLQGTLLLALVPVCLYLDGWLRWVLSGVLVVCSVADTALFLKRNTGFWTRLLGLFRRS